MAKYFMGNTRLGNLERMMMDPSRSAPSRTQSQKNRPCKKPISGQPDQPRPTGQELKEGGV